MTKSRAFILAAIAVLIGGGVGAYVTHRVKDAAEKNKGTKESSVEIPWTEQEKIKGKAYFTDKMFRAELYNGTAWTLTDVDVILAKTNQMEIGTNKFNLRDERRFRCDCPWRS